MAPSERNQLAQGVYAALATPRKRNLAAPDTGAFLDYLDAVAHTGVSGLVLFGATGEFVHFDAADRIHALNLAMKRSRVPVLVNVSHSTLDGALALAEDAIDRGASGILILPPYFYKYDDGDLEEFFLRFSQAVNGRVPVYLYNLPQFGSGLSASLAGRLLRTGRFAGIKDSSSSWELFEALRALRNDVGFRLLAGHERIYLRQQLAGGVDGIVSGVSAATPELMVGLDRCIGRQNLKHAGQLDAYLQEFLLRLDEFPPTVGIKQAAVARGWPLDNFASPLPQASVARLERFRGWVKEWIPFVIQESIRA
jgi:4-hydroxy-tetrahydrodipicolinate synthase